MTNPKTALESTATVAAASIRLTGGREFPHPPHNLRSQELGSLIAPAPLYVVVFSTVALQGMANPKAALDSKATAAIK